MSNKRISYKEKRDGGRREENKEERGKKRRIFLVDLFCDETFCCVHESLYSCQHMSIMTQRLMM